MERFEVQTKAAGKWAMLSEIKADDAAGARQLWRYISNTLSVPARLVTHDYKGRVRVIAKQDARSGYKVTYGETMPVWSRILPTMADAERFAAKHQSFGDIVFSIEAV